MPGYNFISKIRKLNPQRGGVGIFIHNNLKYTEKDFSQFHKDGNFEIVGIDIKELKILLIAIYRPNGHVNSNTQEFINTLELTLKHIRSTSKDRHVIISGDFNIDLLKVDNPQVRDLTDILVTEGFLPLITLPTRVTQYTASTIDHIWSNKADSTSSAIVLNDSYISDHMPNGISFETVKSKKYKTIYKRKYETQNISEFKNQLRDINWDCIFNSDNNDDKWLTLVQKTITVLDKCCPEKKITIPDTIKTNIAPYMTEGLLESRQNLNKLARKANKDPTKLDEDGVSIFEKFTEYKDQYFKLRRITKRKFYNERFSELKHDCKNTWNLINSLVKRKTPKNEISELIEKGESITNPKKISEIFNSFFANVGTSEAKNIPHNETDPMSFLQGLPPESMFLSPTDKDELIKESKKLNKKKSSGWDNIPSFLLLEAIQELAPILAHCINDSFAKGNFAQCLKLAIVVPLHKKSEKTNPTNYRPVSLLTAFSKIIEKIIFKRIHNFIESKLIKEQFGFRPKHCTSDLMIFLLEHINSFINTDKYCMVLFFDLAKAFDTLHHGILLKKLQHYGIRGLPLELIKSYLSN